MKRHPRHLGLIRRAIASLAMLVIIATNISCDRSKPAPAIERPTSTAEIAGDAGQKKSTAKSATAGRREPYPFKRVVVLSIGVNQYPKLRGTPDLRFAQTDAESVANVLVDLYGYEAETLIGPQATKEAIELALKKWSGELGPEDALIVFFAGHGQVIPLPSEGEAGFLIPQDAELDLADKSNPDRWRKQALDMQVMTEVIEGMGARHVLFLADACCSGFMTRQRGSVDRADLKFFLFEPSRTVFAATTRQQKAREGKETGHGYFTAAILEELKKGDAASVIDLYAPVLKSVAEKSNRTMTPQLGSFGDGDGTFVFIPKSIPRSEIEDDLGGRTLSESPARGLGRVQERARQRMTSETTEAQMLEASAAADYRTAVNAADKKAEWEARFERFRENAGLGDPWAIAALHFCYSKGLGTDADPERAYSLARQLDRFEKPAGVGRYLLGRCYQLGLGVTENKEEAIRLFEQSASKGFALGQYSAAVEMLKEEPTAERAKRAKRAKKYLEEASAKGVASADVALAGVLRRGLPGTPRDIPSALALYRKSAERNSPEASFALFQILSEGKPGFPDKDLKQAEEQLRKAADAGLAEAQYILGIEHTKDANIRMRLDLPRDYRESRALYERAALQGYAPALVESARVLALGAGGEAKLNLAKERLEAAVAQDLGRAHMLQGDWYLTGLIYEQSDEKAFACYRRAAVKGDANGYASLGEMYRQGRGFNLDARYRNKKFHPESHRALHWLAESARAEDDFSLLYHEEARKQLQQFRDSLNGEAMGIPMGAGSWPSDVMDRWKREYPDTFEYFGKTFDWPPKVMPKKLNIDRDPFPF